MIGQGIDFLLYLYYNKAHIMNNKQEQFSIIYDEYIEKIYRFVYLKVNSTEIAQDITSKVFLNGWESYNKNQEIKNIGAFLYRIARNMTFDYYREKGRTKFVSIDLDSQVIDPRENIHQKAALNADIELVKSAINNVKGDYQDVLIWHYLDDISINEIAEILDKPAGTVRVTLHRGLKALKDKLVDQV